MFIGIFSNFFRAMIELDDFRSDKFHSEKKLLVNVKHALTFVYFEYSCFVTPNIFQTCISMYRRGFHSEQLLPHQN